MLLPWRSEIKKRSLMHWLWRELSKFPFPISILQLDCTMVQSTDPNDLEALTPNHLLLLKSNPCFRPGLFQKSDLYARKRWRQVQYISDLFWKRWTKEDLPLLQQCQKWKRIQRNFSPGDMFLIVEHSALCGSWIFGRVKGLVRQVWIKTSTSLVCRPVTKICLLQEASDPWHFWTDWTWLQCDLTLTTLLDMHYGLTWCLSYVLVTPAYDWLTGRGKGENNCDGPFWVLCIVSLCMSHILVLNA